MNIFNLHRDQPIFQILIICDLNYMPQKIFELIFINLLEILVIFLMLTIYRQYTHFEFILETNNCLINIQGAIILPRIHCISRIYLPFITLSSDIYHRLCTKASKKRWSWLTRSNPQGQPTRACSRHSMEGKSR